MTTIIHNLGLSNRIACTDYPQPTIITGDDEHREIAKACSSRETGCYTLHQQGELKTNEVHVANKQNRKCYLL